MPFPARVPPPARRIAKGILAVRAPHAFTVAFDRLTTTLDDAFRRYQVSRLNANSRAVLDALDRFVNELERLPGGAAELRRRAALNDPHGKRLNHEAARVEAEGCWWLLRAYHTAEDSPEHASPQRAMLKSIPGCDMLPTLLAAAKSLAAWVEERPEPAATETLPELLDRAGNVFSLAGKLGNAFGDEHQAQRDQIDPQTWKRYAAKCHELYDAVAELRDAIQNPPAGFAAVAVELREAESLARAIRVAIEHPQARRDADFLDCFSSLLTLCDKGLQAVRQATEARRLDDPMALVDATATCPTCNQPAPVDEHGSLRCPDCNYRAGTFGELWIDLKTGGPLSKDDAGDETLCELRHLMRERFGSFDAAALGKLRDWLVATCGLTREQVQVAPRTRLVELLKAALREPPKSSTPAPVGSSSAHALAAMFGGSVEGSWGNETPPIMPTVVPVSPQPAAESKAETSELADGKAAKPKRRGRKKADYKTELKEAALAADWQRARDAGAYKGDFARERGLTVAEFDKLLTRVRKRNSRAE